MRKISVITINYNNVQGLDKTVKSIIGQEKAEFEYIVIDGGSSDGSKALLESLDAKIDFWISEPDKGIYDAMNKGIQKATGEYLLFINSGDYLVESTTLQKAARRLDSGFDIVYGNIKFDEKGTFKSGFMPDKITLSQMMNDTLWHPVSFIKKELFTRYGLYNTSYKICGDYDFFFNVIVSKKVKTKHISQFISVFDLDGMSSDIKNVPTIIAEKEKIQRSYLSEMEIINFREEQKKSSKNFFTRWFR